MNLFDSSSGYQEQSAPRVNGVMVGIVTNNKDPENLARVKLKLPLREAEEETDWVRIATLMAGKDRGSLFVPEVGDEVLVAFHLGEIREPYVIGCLWNKTDTALKPDDKNNIRQIKSRSGHEFTFDDKDGDEKITIKTKKGHKIEFTDKNDTINIVDQSGNNQVKIEGGSKNTITIKATPSEITLNNKGDVSIKGTKSVSVEAPQIKVEAQAQLTLKGGAKVDLISDGIMTIKGSLVKIN